MEVAGFVAWLHGHNTSLQHELPKVGFYGLDLYSLHTSINAVLTFLGATDKAAARRARERYSCFDHFGRVPGSGIEAAGFGLTAGCEKEAIAQLVELRKLTAQGFHVSRDSSQEDMFFAEQNARLVKNAEQYYRTLFHDGSSWNVRDRHMMETLDALIVHLSQRGKPPKIVLWEHNSHLGDARATEMGEAGEINVGQLTRERYGTEAKLVGFTTYSGTVTAASDWNGDMARKWVRPRRHGAA
ncbi:MAG: erythromycin esterase-like enzyme [Nitrospira sp.]|nr:erythromycin esterase-like enzyme [Nitrospira sp.]